ncbi:uncharacterized protein J3D65DRAFT_679860 [Phyllosticta citribraziliensis]|uniref:Integral membrane protein n=1 Tax=Phyllosticta citribraziliensis TaxID=989973 RepID=A0ABR1L9T9_9PEZI
MAPQAPLALLFVLAIALAAVQAQQVQLLNYDALPGCAKGCTNLKTAQDGCIPPQAGVSTQQTYVSCFCQSAFLVNLKTTAQGLCDAACPSTSDQNGIKDWYNKFCQSGGTEGAAGGGGQKTEPSKTAGSASTPSPSTAKNNNNEQGVVSDKTSYQGSWISAHWRWIVMIVVIFTGLMLLTLLGLYLKRRSRARHDARQANVAAPEAAFSAPLPPAAPPMAHAKHTPDDSGTLTSTIDFGSTSSITAAGPNSSVGNIAQNFLGRNRSRSNPLGRFPNTSQNNVVQPVPNPLNVWGPHQHQAATRGYEYPTYQNGSGRAPSRSDPRLNGYGASPSTDASPVSPSPGTGSPNASFPHIAAGAAGAAFPSSSPSHGYGHSHGPGPSPLGAGAGTPRKSSSRGELANKAAGMPPQPLIAAAGNAPSPSTPPSASSKQARERTPPSAGSGARSTGSASSRPEVPRLNTAVGNASKAKALPPTPQQPTTPPRQTTPKTPQAQSQSQSQTPPAATAGATATPPSSSSKPAVVSRPPPANGSRSVRERERLAAYDLERGEAEGAGERHHYRTRSQEYGAAASYHNAGFATGGSVYRRNNNKKENAEKEGGGEVLRGRSVGRGGALVAGDEAEVQKTGGGAGGGGWADVSDAVAGAANMVARSFDDLHARAGAGGMGVGGSGINRDGLGSHRRVTSPLSADNAREKLRRKLSRQGSGFFDQDGVEGRGEREGFEGL